VSGPVSSNGPRAGVCLHPNRVAIRPVEGGTYGIDFTYHGATGYADAEAAERILQAGGLVTSFRQELDSACTVRLGPLPARAHASGARSLRVDAGMSSGRMH